ncbi:MAG: tetratricopeptide repeat protein [Flavobacteriales bacterium]|nr:tetratricopeptide repeat protein [Flavobacteriales bacterium]
MSNKINPHETKEATHDVDLGQVYTRTERFIENNKQALTMGVVGILVIVGGLLGYKKFVAEPKAKEAAELIWKAEYYFEIDSLEKALNGDDQWPGFLTIADDFGSTPSGNLANYYLGTIYMQKGEFEMALEHYRKADMGDEILSVMAVGNQGDALVELGRTDEAVKLFEKAAAMETNDLTTPMYLMKAGIIHHQSSNWAAAAKAFERIANEFPSSNEANQARKYAGHAEALGG